VGYAGGVCHFTQEGDWANRWTRNSYWCRFEEWYWYCYFKAIS